MTETCLLLDEVMTPSGHRPRIDILLYALRAEGTPRLALDLCRIWKAWDIDVSVTVMFDAPSELRAAFEAQEIPLRFLRMPGPLWARWAVLAADMFWSRRQRRDAALISMVFGWHAMAFLGARCAGRGIAIAHIGNLPVAERARRWLAFRFLVSLGRPFTSAYACCSSHVARGVAHVLRLPGSSLHVIPNGVSAPPDLRPRRHRASSLRVGMVATLEPHKDHATLLRAMALLRPRLFHCGMRLSLELAGDGTLRGRLTALAYALGISDCVKFLGTVHAVPAFLAQLDIFVFSTTECEGQGIALLEAMAAGVPVIASDVGACREVLENGGAGLLAEARNPVALADALMKALLDDDETEARRQRAFARVSTVFDIELTAARYMRLCLPHRA